MYKYAYADTDSWEFKTFTAEKYGKFNDPPPNLKEITEKEFARSDFFSFTPRAMDYRQIRMNDSHGREVYQGMHLYFMHDGTGYGMVHDYWGGVVRYFRFALCEHEFRELSAREAGENGVTHYGNCYHVLKCKKCGYVTAYDSSD